MREKGFSQKELAENLNVHNSTISEWLNKKSLPTEKNIQALAELLGVSPNEIVSDLIQKSIGNQSYYSYSPSFDFSATVNLYLSDSNPKNAINMEEEAKKNTDIIISELREKLKKQHENENTIKLVKSILNDIL